VTGVTSFLRRAYAHIRYRLRPPPPAVSTEYEIVDGWEAGDDAGGWRESDVAQRQQAAFEPLLEAARQGRPRVDFQVAARALEATGIARPSVVEVGCGSGYYSEMLPLLLGRPVDYLGLDYSPPMVTLARQIYPAARFLSGDACALPLGSGSFDVVLSGTSLMHIVEYERAIAEGVRVARAWCIFHTVTLLERRATTLLRKRAYGAPVLEVVFNRGELEAAFARHGLRIVQRYESIPYDLAASLGESTQTWTYLCQKTS
jgi:SAM-dependent methyltransferase